MPSLAIRNNSCIMKAEYPRFTLHGTNGSFTLPPVIRKSGKKKVVKVLEILEQATEVAKAWNA